MKYIIVMYGSRTFRRTMYDNSERAAKLNRDIAARWESRFRWVGYWHNERREAKQYTLAEARVRWRELTGPIPPETPDATRWIDIGVPGQRIVIEDENGRELSAEPVQQLIDFSPV